MKKEKLKIVFEEIWQSSQLRFVNRVVYCKDDSIKIIEVLQQLFRSNLGNIEWRDVPYETEEKQ